MLSTVGTRAFHAYSRKLYGVPGQPLRYDPATPLELAQKVHESPADLQAAALIPPVIRSRTGGRSPCSWRLRSPSTSATLRPRWSWSMNCRPTRWRPPARSRSGVTPSSPRRTRPSSSTTKRSSMWRPASTVAPRPTSRSWRSAIPVPLAPRRGSPSTPNTCRARSAWTDCAGSPIGSSRPNW